MQKFVLVSTLIFSCMSGLSFAADNCTPPKRPSCSELGYGINTTNPQKKCGKYFTCPFDSTWIKCDEEASIGDIKYSKKTSDHNGWLLCDGRPFSTAGYPALYGLLGHNFGSVANLPMLPDYRGVFLRGMGTQNKLSAETTVYKLQSQQMQSHNHYFDYGKIAKSYLEPRGETVIKQRTYFNDYTPETVDTNKLGSEYLCPIRTALNVFIYAGPTQ